MKIPRPPVWWAGGIARGMLVVAGLSWIGMLAAASKSETLGMLGARLAVGPTAFGIGALVMARRTRYAPGVSARVAAPLAVGWLAAVVSVVFLEGFFATIWRAL